MVELLAQQSLCLGGEDVSRSSRERSETGPFIPVILPGVGFLAIGASVGWLGETELRERIQRGSFSGGVGEKSFPHTHKDAGCEQRPPVGDNRGY